ncbi:MAG: fibronectin type III domain-containing protein [Chloroflexota bacterium]|nr:fibronectin type III domain-containing protein [Chloroflexota bacterium]
MAERSWSTERQEVPPVSWDGRTGTFSIVLSKVGGDDGDGIEAEWTPPITYVVRIREIDTGEWSIGFETPLTGCGFVGLKPGTEYEVEVRSKNKHGESDPVLVRARTNPEGNLGI